jgi:thiol:disulfide interchange protein DsbD
VSARRLVFCAALATSALFSRTGASEGAPPIHWLEDEAAARALSRSTGRPLLIDFRADWCSACKMLDRSTWSDPAVRTEVAARYVPLQIDVTAEDDLASERTRRYGVSALPTVLVGGRRLSGFVRAKEMLEALRGAGRRSK